MRQDVLDKARDDPRGTAARVLDAAEEVFAEQGYAGASTREIARRARVPFGAVHYHWGSKRGLREAVYARLGERIRETFLGNYVPGRTTTEIIDNMTDAFLEMMLANRTRTRLACRTFLEPRNPRIEAMFQELTKHGFELFREMIPDPTLDFHAVMLLVANAFTAVMADEAGQETVFGGSVFTSRPARERLRAQLKRMNRLMFGVRE